MKCLCPACGRSTVVPPDLMDFLSRCERCGALLRARVGKKGLEQQGEKKHQLTAKVVPVGRIHAEATGEAGALADLLSRKQGATVTIKPPATPNAGLDV